MNENDSQMIEDDESLNKMILKFIRLREESQAHDMFFRLRYMNNHHQAVHQQLNNHQPNSSIDSGTSTNSTSPTLNNKSLTTSNRLQKMLDSLYNNQMADMSSDEDDNDDFSRKPKSGSDQLRTGGLFYSKAWKDTSFNEPNTWKSAWQQIVNELDDVKISDIEKYLKIHTEILEVREILI